MDGIQGATVLVTGAAGGIGKAAALHLARLGAKVVAVDINAPGADATAHDIAHAGGTAMAIAADLSQGADCRAMVAKATAAFGTPTLAFNNAGIAAMGTLIADTDEADFDRVIAVNLRSVFLCMKYEVLAMRAAGLGGAIVNTASVAGIQGIPTLGSYVASKHAVVGLSQSAALEYACDGIRVNVLCPGLVDTPMSRQAADLINPMTTNPMQRAGTADELANLAVFLLSAAASFVTGAVFTGDGGQSAG